MQNYNSANIKIVKNSDTVQAVRHLGLDMMQVLFYKAGTLSDGTISVTVNAPCALLFKNLSTSNVLVSIADPSQQNGNINLTFQLPGIIGGPRYLSARLPTGELAGASARFLLNQNLPSTPPASLTAIADAYIRDGTYAGTNYGSATMLIVKKESGSGYSREAIFKFDPRSIQRPISNAKLHVYLSYANTQAASTQWAVYQTNSGWTESTINWNNKPAPQNLIATIQGQASAGYVDWDISSLINSLHPDSLLSLKLVATTINALGDAGFGSKESAFVPQIIIDDTPPLTQSFAVVADAYVKSGTSNVNTNFGSAGYLAAQNGFYESYLKFDWNNLAGTVVGARLKLNSLASAATQWQLYKVNNNNWTETGITWSTKPAGTDSLVATINASAGTVYFDIGSLLKNISAEGLISFRIVATANVYSSFSSNQAATVSLRPRIDYYVDTTGSNGSMMAAKTEMVALKSRLQNTLISMKTAGELKVSNASDIMPANLITPNGDGRNDAWLIKNIEDYKNNSVKVFAINGQLIYSKRGYDNSWGATYNGTPLADGVYVYIIDKGDQTPLVKGVLNVIGNFK
jgi:chondroitin AC lyase